MQLEKMREAMMVIAEARDSERLRQFIAIGQDRMFLAPVNVVFIH